MRIVLLLALGGCMTSEPVREGRARIELDNAERGTATYRVVSGSNDSECAHGQHFTPLRDADVQFGPSGGELVRLVETADGTYTGTAPTVYAAAYQFTVDGEPFELIAPAAFSAKVQSMSASLATIELSDISMPSDVVIHLPNGRSMARTVIGSPAEIAGDFSLRGEYQIDVIRTFESASGVVEIQRQTALTVP